MANISTWLEKALLNHVFRNTELAVLAAVYAGLVSDAASDANMEAGTLTNEITAYTGNRRTLTFGAPTQQGDNARCLTTTASDFEAMPAVTTAFAIICDSATKGAGNILVALPLTVSRTTAAGDTLRFAAGDIFVDFA